ncbi:hypothetical protein N7492_008826 [Penicillium capsulatum]|uniref:Uncharacterized protein n=1 Tax=Penicillium capsulatum TaxID=69766 RepID=A0A9W9HQF7_9EURO|nr:hypothetical protein N7492_008826 [Penicillium capsulatum]
MMTTNHSCLFSPKRKREPSESDYYSPSASPTSTISLDSFQEARLREEVELGRHSPRAAVAGRFGELAIRGERRPSLGLANEEWQPASSLGQKLYAPDCRVDSGGHPNDLSATTGESPEAQDSHPLVSLTQEDITKAPATPIASPSLKKLASSPHKKSNPTSPSKSRKKRLSPPLAGDSLEDPFTWHDSEITGHNPTDPTDDGYGINGVGFKPTAAMAWARSQKRQKQVAEWKNREAREARERRRERRNEAINMDKIHSIQQGAINKRVKFDV